MPQDRSERVVVRVTHADGSVVNVRKEDLQRFLAANAGAVAEGPTENAQNGPENGPDDGGDTVEEVGMTAGRRRSK